MANKRVSELVQITAPELTVDDLLLLADVTAHESKKLRLADLNAFLLTTANSGSFYGTSSWAQYAVWALGAPTPNFVNSSSNAGYAVNAGNAVSAINAISASYSFSGSYVQTASYALTSSMLLIYSAVFADYAKSASYLIYSGIPNGTASLALTASLTRGTSSYAFTASTTTGTASFSNTSSYAFISLYTLNSGSAISSVLYALSASWSSASLQSVWATQSLSASYLNYNGIPNGTASYALVAGGYPSVRINYGVYPAISQSSFNSQLDRVIIPAPNGGFVSSSFEALGSVVIPFTMSLYNTCSIELIALDRWTGITASLDRSPLDVFLPTSGAGTGSILVPFSLMGEWPLSGSVTVYVTASQGAIINPNRLVRFDVTSVAQNVYVTPYETMSLRVIPNSGPLPIFTYTSSGILTSGVDSDCFAAPTVTEINISNLNVFQVKYLWMMSSLTKFNGSVNGTLYDVGGMPLPLVSMSLNTCALFSLAPLAQNVNLKYVDVGRNNIPFIPSLPAGLWYLDCSRNDNLAQLPSPLPSALQYLSVSGTAMTSLPTLPITLTHLDISNCLFSAAQIEVITNQLVAAGLTNGYLNTSGNGVTYTAQTLTNFATLSPTRGWTVVS